MSGSRYVRDLDEARAAYARMHADGETFGSPSDDPQIRERLIELGLLNPETDTAVDASVALIGTLAGAHDDLDALARRQAIAATLTRHFLGIADPHDGEVSVEFFPRADLPRLQQAIDELTELATGGVVRMHPPVAVWPEPVTDQSRHRTAGTWARGVRSRGLYQQSNLNDPAFRNHMKRIAAEGDEIRFAPTSRPGLSPSTTRPLSSRPINSRPCCACSPPVLKTRPLPAAWACPLAPWPA